MQFGPLNHVGIITPSVEHAMRFYREIMGATTFRSPVVLDDGSAAIGFVQAPNALVELIEPLAKDTEIADFLAAHPQGAQHHLCYEVPDIHIAWNHFAGLGVRFACPIVTGVLGHPIFFIDGTDVGGQLIEIIEIAR